MTSFPKRVAVIFVFALVLLILVQPAHAQGMLEITDQRVDYLFNSFLHFSAQYQSPEKMIEGSVFFQVGQDKVYEGDLGSNQTLDVLVALNATNTPKAFSSVTYWFRLTSDHGDFFDSPRFSFYYEDNRYNWQQFEKPPFTLRWHAGDEAFTQAILSAADQGVMRAAAMLPLPPPQPMTFQVYDNVQDVQLVSQLAGYSWLAGHSDLAFNLILFSLAPGPQQSLEIERQVPHEVAHLLLYQAFGANDYANLPVWLNEGFASSAEVYSDPLRKELLDLANETDTLIPFYSLCAAFPQDANSARLAYAQSASFVSYLYERYSQAGFNILVEAYAETGDCLNASVASFGEDLSTLESDWRQATFASQNGLVQNLQSLPWPTIAVAAGVAIALWALLRR